MLPQIAGNKHWRYVGGGGGVNCSWLLACSISLSACGPHPNPQTHIVCQRKMCLTTHYFASKFYMAQKYPILWKMYIFILKTQQLQ
jgi:hypothetical protein